MKTFKEFLLNESSYDFSTEANIVKFVRNNTTNRKFGQKADVSYSKKHNGYLYKAESKIPGVWFETGWTHQNYKFYIMFDGYKTPEVENILNQFIKDEKSFNKDGEFHLSATRTSANPYLMFEKTNKYSKALCEELADSITGYSQEDL